MFEFAQGSSPKVLWCNSAKLLIDKDSFLLYVVNTPTYVPKNEYNPKPTIIQSEFSTYSYVAVFSAIPDVEARGFSRPIVMVYAHPQKEYILAFYSIYYDKLLMFSNQLQQNATSFFPNELAEYASCLKHTIEKFPESKTILSSKMAELDNTLASVGISIEDAHNDIVHPPEHFTRINNELRPIISLTKFSDMIEQIVSFSLSLPKSYLGIKSMSFVQDKIDSSEIAIMTKDYTLSSFKLSSLYHSHVLLDVLFHLLSGKHLYISSINHEEALSFARRLSILHPFSSIFSFNEDNSSIFVGFFVDKNEQPGFLDLDASAFVGAKCPKDSILSKEIIRVEHSENIFIPLICNDIKKIGSRFLRKVKEIVARGSINKEKFFAQMRNLGFSSTDEPIINNLKTLGAQTGDLELEAISKN